MHHPSRLETPLDDNFSDAEEFMELPQQVRGGDGHSAQMGGEWDDAMGVSRVPKLPAIQPRKRVSMVQQHVAFEIPGESGIEHVLWL